MERTILTLNDTLLKTKSETVTLPLIADELQLLEDMYTIVKTESARGVSAVQLGMTKRIILIEKPSGSKRYIEIINPNIIGMSGRRQRPEGCLSIPLPIGVAAMVERPSTVKVQYFNRLGESTTETLTGNNAQTFLHEYAHLEGYTMVDNSRYGKFMGFVRV